MRRKTFARPLPSRLQMASRVCGYGARRLRLALACKQARFRKCESSSLVWAGYKIWANVWHSPGCPPSLRRLTHALDTIEKSLADIEQTSEREAEAELYRIKGEALLIQNDGAFEDAQSCFC